MNWIVQDNGNKRAESMHAGRPGFYRVQEAMGGFVCSWHRGGGEYSAALYSRYNEGLTPNCKDWIFKTEQDACNRATDHQNGKLIWLV